ncbi:MAG: amino acid ABC transporter permease [Verrucomicrobiota bacterium]
MYQWDFSWVWTYREQLFEALWVTIHINLVILILGTLLGITLGLLGKLRSSIGNFVLAAYVDFFRSLPVLVGLVWFFYCAPMFLGGMRISAYASAVIVLSLNLSAFVAEIIRSGLNSVPKGIIESSRALGVSRTRTMRSIVIPIATRIIVPPLLGQYINSIKLSVLASIISVPELLSRTTDIISQTYRPLEFYTVLAILFLALLTPLTLAFRYLERRFSKFSF